MKKRLAALALALMCCRSLAGAPLYSLVEGADKFEGSAAARELLQSNGFVVADPSFKHIWEPYVQAPLPVFITVDSAWHTYHLLLDYGLGQIIPAQSQRLATFSRRLMTLAREQSLINGPDFVVLSSYAALGLALQDETFAESLAPGEKKIIDTLRSGVGSVETGLGFPLAARPFKPAKLHSPPAELAGYFAARQWYATVVFRLADPRETRLALCLARLIHDDPNLSKGWNELAGLDEELRGPSDDASVPAYFAVAQNLSPAEIANNVETLRSTLEKTIRPPEVNDQLLAGDDAVNATSAINGFRLFPPRRLPRWAGATNSTASLRQAISAPLAESIFGQSLRALTTLQDPLPDSAPDAFHSPAWQDLQLWTQLGCWAELLPDPGAIAENKAIPTESPDKSAGTVAPYPKFFAGLAGVSRRAASLLGQAGASEAFNNLIHDFALMCDRLALLAQKQLNDVGLDADDIIWIRNYGATLQKFSFDDNESGAGPFPIASPLSSDPAQERPPEACLADAETLYIILPRYGRLRLFCGAVLSYRQGVPATESNSPSDAALPAPEFTRTFRSEKTLDDLFSDLDSERHGSDGFGNEQSPLDQLQERLTDADLPKLIRWSPWGDDPSAPQPILALAPLIAKLNWKPYQLSLLQLIQTNDQAFSAVAMILSQQPEALDPEWLRANFDQQPPPVRALFCRLLRHHSPAPAIVPTLYRALRDPDSDVRWSSIGAIRALRLTNDQVIAALTENLANTDEYVADAAAHALAVLGATNTAPLLLTNLLQRLRSPEPTAEQQRSQRDVRRRLAAISENIDDLGKLDSFRAHLGQPPDLPNLRPVLSAVDSLAQALAQFNYQPAIPLLFDLVNSGYAASAVHALDLLAPERIRAKLIGIACDQQKTTEARDRALQLLLQTSPSKEAARRLEPVLDETAEMRMDLPGRAQQLSWHLCDRAVQVIGHLLGQPPTRVILTTVQTNADGPAAARLWLKDAGTN